MDKCLVMATTFNHLHRSSQNEYSNGPFCTQDNALNLIAYINQEFELLGFPSLSVESPSKISSDVIFLINRLQDIFNLYHKTVRIKDDLQNRNHRLLCDLEHQQSTQVHLKQKRENTERELQQEKEKCRQCTLKYKQVCGKLRTECEETKRLRLALQSSEIQHKHELNKKEREINKLKERLHQLLADKVPDRKVGMDLMSLVSGNDGRRATWKTSSGKQEEETYQVLINNYDERHQELIQENAELCDCMLSLKRELSSLLRNSQEISGTSTSQFSNETDVYDPLNHESGSIKSSHLAVSNLNQGHFQLPVDMMRYQVEQSFKTMCEQIRQIMRKGPRGRRSSLDVSSVKSTKAVDSNSSGKDNPDKKRSSPDKRNSSIDSSEIEKLKRQIGNYKAIIQQQEDLIQQTLALPSHAKENSLVLETTLMREKDNFSQQKKMFHEEKVNFDKERKIFTDAAIRLAKERKAFEEEKAGLLKQHFLNMSPFRAGNTSKAKGDGPVNRLLPATPVFSPARSKLKSDTDLPSTPELFKALGLSPDIKAKPRQDLSKASGAEMTPASIESPLLPSSNHSASSISTDVSMTSSNASQVSGAKMLTRPSSSHSYSSCSSSLSTPTVEEIKASLMAKNGHK